VKSFEGHPRLGLIAESEGSELKSSYQPTYYMKLIAIQSLLALEIRYQRGLREIADLFVCSDRDPANSCYQVRYRYL
jgi:hypothetical protein